MVSPLRRTRVTTAGVAAACLTVPLVLGATLPAAAASGQDQPNIDARAHQTLFKQGLEFKDSNGNGQVDRYEDWRLTPEERAKDLVKRMTVEEKAGLMQITSEGRGERPGGIDSTNPDAVKYVTDRQIRYLILRDNPTAHQLADRANKYQEIAEDTRLGIPIVFTSNPRNHVNPDQQFGISEATGQFSLWPGTTGLAATGDAEVVRGFAETARAEWRAAGIHKIYGYQIETATEPRWNRNNGTFGESPDLNAAIARELVLGFQGDELGPDSVAQTIKHFPGDGAVDRGLDPHYEVGQYAIYPTENSLYDYQLPPFQAAIDAGASSVMSYYNVPKNEGSAAQLPRELWVSETQQFDEVAGAYSTQFLKGVLRDQLGFQGYVNTDSGVLSDKAWGVGDLTVPERYAKAVKAGSAIFSDTNDPAPLIEAVKTGLLKESELDPKVRSLLEEIFTLGLFENPYVDPASAQEIADSPASQALADEAHDKSITLLRNDSSQLPLSDGFAAAGKLYVEVFTGSAGEVQTAAIKEVISASDPGVQFTATPEEADAALVLVRPSIYALPDDAGHSIALNPDTGINVDRINEIQAAVPTILAINTAIPWLVDSIEPGAESVIATFDVKTESLWDAIRGRFNPTGKLPISLPADQAAVDANAPDVPGYAESFDYSYTNAVGDDYEFGFGLSYTIDGSGIPVTGEIPEAGPGSLILTIDDFGAGVALSDAVDAGDRWTLAGQLPGITVSDTRSDAAGWTAAGQSSEFSSGAGSLNAAHLGWVPKLLEQKAGVAAGAAVQSTLSGGQGLSLPSTLGTGSGPDSRGNARLGSDLLLEVPIDADAGTYQSELTVSLFPLD